MQKYCTAKGINDIDDQLLEDGKCNLSVPLEEQIIYFINEHDIKNSEFIIENYVFAINSNDNITIENNILTGHSIGKNTITMMVDDILVKTFDVVVTDVITEMPREFDRQKAVLSCRQFSSEEALLLDEILPYRISEAGEGTRAEAVAVARFLT